MTFYFYLIFVVGVHINIQIEAVFRMCHMNLVKVAEHSFPVYRC